MDILAWLRCFTIRRELESFLKRSHPDSHDPVTLEFIKDGHCWTLLVERAGRELAAIKAVPGPKLTVSFRGGPLDGRYVISRRHPAYDGIFRLTAAFRERESERAGLN